MCRRDRRHRSKRCCRTERGSRSWRRCRPCMAFVSAATRIAGLGDLPRCANPRQLMTYLGLVSSEQSSGASVTRDSITKASNSAACGPLIDAA